MSEHLIGDAYPATRNVPTGNPWSRSVRQRFGGGSMPPGGHSRQAAYIERDGDRNVDARLDRLDTKVDGLAGDVAGLRVETATLAERISHLPSKEWVDERLGRQLRNLSIIVGLIVAVATIIGIFAKP